MASRLFAAVCAGWCCAALADQGGVLNVIVEGPTASASTALSNEFAAVRRDATLLRSSISRQSKVGADEILNARTTVGLLAAQSTDVAALPGVGGAGGRRRLHCVARAAGIVRFGDGTRKQSCRVAFRRSARCRDVVEEAK